jgi:hypothetical protein
MAVGWVSLAWVSLPVLPQAAPPWNQRLEIPLSGQNFGAWPLPSSSRGCQGSGVNCLCAGALMTLQEGGGKEQDGGVGVPSFTRHPFNKRA